MNRPFLGKTFASFCRLRSIRLYALKLVSGQMNGIFLWNCVADSAVGNKQVCARRKDLVMNTSHIGQSLAFNVWRFDFSGRHQPPTFLMKSKSIDGIGFGR